jgi:antitoxin HigA-1
MKRKIAPISPGEMLEEEFLKPLGLRMHRLAEDVRVSPQRMHDIIAGKSPITDDEDLKLCQYFGLSPGWWLRGQDGYDADNSYKSIT